MNTQSLPRTNRIVMNIDDAQCTIKFDDTLLSPPIDRREIHEKIEIIDAKIQQQKKSIEQYQQIQEDSPGIISGLLLVCYENLLRMYQEQKEEYERLRDSNDIYML